MRGIALIAILWYCAAAVAPAQYEVIVTEPVRASSLAGVVVDSSGAFIPHTSVSLIDCPVGGGYPNANHRALMTTETDSHGAFLIKPGRFPKPYCLRLTALGFDPLEFEVKLSHFAGRMRLKMTIAT